MPPVTCPNCGAVVPRKARCCPECGADENSGWSDSAQADRLGIPEENFDYERFVKEEFGREPKPRGIFWIWWVTALILVLLFGAYFLFH
jgi:RNA polymerase subunit RPABC4/transcription elongation factor Spt4